MIALGVVLLVLVLLGLRRRRKATLAGLNAAKPSYVIAPPTRWSTSGRDHRL